MMNYRTVTFLILLLEGPTVFANSLLHSNVDSLLRLRRLDRAPVRHRFLLDITHNDNGTYLNEYALPVISGHSLKRDDTSTIPTFDEAAFNQSAITACANAVNNYTEAINPSGIVACYNIATWDNTTGVFETDVRLYQKSAPIGSFEGIDPTSFSMSFSIAEATLSSPRMMTTNSSVTADSPATGQFVGGFQNIGQLTKSLHFSKLTE